LTKTAAPPSPVARPRNKGKLIGAKPPLRPNQAWSIRTRLLIERRTRDLALFNLAIDSKLRGCDVVALRVEDVAPNGYAVDRATVRQKKTGRPVKFVLTDQTRQAVDDFLKSAGKKPGDYLFTGRRGPSRAMTTRKYACLLADWVASIGLDPKVFGTHSLRRTKAKGERSDARCDRRAFASHSRRGSRQVDAVALFRRRGDQLQKKPCAPANRIVPTSLSAGKRGGVPEGPW